jgi:hypothetical protein
MKNSASSLRGNLENFILFYQTFSIYRIPSYTHIPQSVNSEISSCHKVATTSSSSSSNSSTFHRISRFLNNKPLVSVADERRTSVDKR